MFGTQTALGAFLRADAPTLPEDPSTRRAQENKSTAMGSEAVEQRQGRPIATVTKSTASVSDERTPSKTSVRHAAPSYPEDSQTAGPPYNATTEIAGKRERHPDPLNRNKASMGPRSWCTAPTACWATTSARPPVESIPP
jgi:hypothetical protein